VSPDKEVFMSDRSATPTPRSRARTPDLDTGQVLDALRNLIERARSPVVRECLIEVRRDITFLATPEGVLPEEAEDAAGAAA
jgi:hypothetical protein